MSQPADLPLSTIAIRIDNKRSGDTRCEVWIDGKAVALLPLKGVEFAQHWGSQPTVKLSLPIKSIDVQTHSPSRTT